jgi:protein tyrosine/serine phosphatase
VSSAPQSQPRSRALSWDGCVNVRDLGGHPTEDGNVTRFGRIVRADSVRQLTEEGWAALVGYGIRTVVDLRYHNELEADPPRALDVEVVHISLLGEPDEERWAELDAIAAAARDVASSTRAVYLEVMEDHRANIATAVAAVGHASKGGVVVHCHAGKDRTGLVTALLLRLAGVSCSDVAADYSLSERNLAAQIEEWVAEAEDEEERARRVRIGATPADGMLGVLEEIERRYGDVRAYLRAGGASDSDLDAVRARLLEE